MEDLLDFGKQVPASQPFSVLPGAELLGFYQGCAELKVPIRPELKQEHGFVHGEVISYAAGNALTFAGGGVLGPGVVMSEFKTNYLRPAMGDFLGARAPVIYSSKSQAVCRCVTCSCRMRAKKACVQPLRAQSQA
jgi:acyl-coenzyme A thioesterase PaaI-like protein